MTPDVDLRDVPAEKHRDILFDALADAGPDDELHVVSDQDVDAHLVRYQIERGRGLNWGYADPDAEPRELHVREARSLDDGERGTIDVRDLEPQRRHEALLAIFEELEPGEGFVLVNDHDPKPLYHELESMHGDVIGWEYRSRGADGWRVEITRTGESNAAADDVVTRYDVREIPKEERHPTIHHRYGMIPEGGTMELIAPHEPRPLHREFRQRYGDAFTWEVVESEPGRCRARITKGENDDETSADASATAGDGEVGDSGADDEIEVTAELNVRDLPPAQRHEKIFERYADLDGGEGFVLVNDHDPEPLYHQFEAEAGPEFRWESRQKDPGEFRVRIGKASASTDQAAGSEPEAPF
ncbi:MAG: DUF2249 domain-containing protein [Halorientalis sp.]